MSNIIKDYLNPEIITKLQNIELKAKQVIEGFLIGLHNSPYHGFSVEFAEHRPYNPGDPIKNIDWKVFARTNKYYIKEFEEETNLRAYIILDVSASMKFTSGTITKLEYAKTIAAALSYLLIKQKDAVGITAFNEDIIYNIPPKSKLSHLQYILKIINNIQPAKKTNIFQVLNKIISNIHKRSLIIFISDLFEEPDKVIQSIKNFRYSKHDVIVMHILDPQEVNFNYKRDTRFIDLETNEKIDTQAHHIRKEYVKTIKKIIDKYKIEFENNYIDYNLFTTDQSYDKVLLYYLEKRKKLG